MTDKRPSGAKIRAAPFSAVS
ncbi:hypothetical protein D030_2416A, partial [Vibrio parahaemolyticus AQ3810]